MAFDDRFRISSHAVITNAQGEVLLLGLGFAGGCIGTGRDHPSGLVAGMS